jgi:hypothetical protein
MHSLFLDEAYHDVDGGRIIVVGAWAADQARFASHAHLLDELHQPGKSPLLKRIATVFESLNAQGLIAWAEMPGSIFRSGEVDRTNDIPAMARADNIWSTCMIYAICELLFLLFVRRQGVGTVDVYFDERKLKRDHVVAVEMALKELMVREAKRFGAQLGAQQFRKLNIRRFQPVEKASSEAPTKLQNGTWISDRLLANSKRILNAGAMPRIEVHDMSDVVERTIQQFDGKSFREAPSPRSKHPPTAK